MCELARKERHTVEFILADIVHIVHSLRLICVDLSGCDQVEMSFTHGKWRNHSQ